LAVQVRIKNFQSIKDSSIVIDGLTAITGTNNSGKTAAMRAIRGVFTNPPAGPLVRHGKAFLSVSLSFDDGTTVTWEKGWEKPEKKGKTVNRYYVNGHPIENVGSGVPPEVESLGVRDVKAASDKVWPQIAEQFDGALFLVNRPGSVVAEALSDVEKVGKLTEALKLSEKDNRSVKSELKVRMKDLTSKEEDLSRYDGLDDVGVLVSELETRNSTLESQKSQVSKVESLLGSLGSATSRVDGFSGFDPDVVPDSSRIIRVAKGVEKVSGLLSRLESSRSALDSLSGFHELKIPDHSDTSGLLKKLELVEGLSKRLSSAQEKSERYQGFEGSVPDSGPMQKDLDNFREAAGFFKRLSAAKKDLEERSSQLEVAHSELESASLEVKRILEELGVCPVCNSPHHS
jgi:DNA repair exonuclease SbcCD ATPase subunit